MPKVLFIGAHRANRSPSQRFRFEQYFDFLRSNGIECELLPLLNEEEDKTFYSQGNYLKKGRVVWNAYKRRRKDLAVAKRFDLIFIQREAFMTGSTFFEKEYSRLGKKIIFDFDDAIWLPNVSEGNKRFSWLKNPSKTRTILQLSDHVIAGNRFLAKYASEFNPNVTTIPTTIDTSYHTPQLNAGVNEICIGWTGSHTTTEHFKLALPALKEIAAKYGSRVSFKLIGDPSFEVPELRLKGQKWDRNTEIQDLAGIDIGIMPLPDTEWAKGKCGLKALQYMALEKPCVMSPVGVNTEIIDDGIHGFLATSTQEWVEKLSRLIDDQELRSRIGVAARNRVEERYSVNSQKNRYLELFRKLLSA